MYSYKFRLYPNKEQEKKLNFTLAMCRLTYNFLLSRLNEQKVIDRNQIQADIVDFKIIKPELKDVYSKTLQYECYRLFSNLKGLSQSKKNGRKVGQLRFKGKNWFKTFVINQSGFWLEENNSRFSILKLSKIGEIKLRQHRKIEGKIKQIIIKKNNSGKWFAIIQTDFTKQIKRGDKEIGIDLGLNNFVTDSEGKVFHYPKAIRKYENKLTKEQRKLSRKKKGSKNREKARIKVAHVHEKIVNSRDDFLHKITSYYVKEAKILVLEDLNVKGMIKNKYLSKSISDASWSKFVMLLQNKAENAGIEVIKINPKNTSQICSRCGRKVRKSLAIRTHKCSCGLVIDRDYNSALLIKKLGLGQSFEPLELEALPSLMRKATSDYELGSYNPQLLKEVRL